MATTHFILRGTRPGKPQSITLLFRYGNSHLKYSTGYKVHLENWNSEKQEVRNKVEVFDRNMINDGLNEIRTRINSIYTSLIKDGKQIDNETLRSRLNDEKEPEQLDTNSPYVQTFLKHFLEKIDKVVQIKSNGRTEPIKQSTIKQYRNTLKMIVAFDQIKGSKTRFDGLNIKFHSDFLDFLHGDQKLAYSTIAGRIKNLKTLSNHARREGISVCEDVFTRNFFKPTDESLHTYLNESEIKRIFEFDFSNNPRLDKTRDLLIVGLWTALRISDFTKITKMNIQDGFFQLDEQQKTGGALIIPIHPHVKSVIEKYNGEIPHKISHQKFNVYIKEICALVGISDRIEGTKKIKTELGQRKITGVFPKHELVTSHICRRSFATNLYGKLPTLTIMAVTGHKSEKTFLNYIKVTPKQHAETLRAYWEQNSISTQ